MRCLLASLLLCVLDATTLRAARSEPTEQAESKQLRLDSNPNPLSKRWLEGLPVMSADHSPDSPTWDNSIAVCAVMKDENLQDVMEWITYYKWLGVDHIFLTDNNSRNYRAVAAALTRAFPDTFLTLRSDTYDRAQVKAYAWCAEEHRESYNWIAFFDLDEYLVLREGQAQPAAPDVRGLLDAYKNAPALSVHWIWVGPSGHDVRPSDGGVLRHYTQCDPVPDKHIKTIVNTWFLDGTTMHPHNFYFRDGALSEDEKGDPVPLEWRKNPVCTAPEYALEHIDCKRASARPTDERFADFDKCCMTIAAALHRNAPSVDRVALFHYSTKSWEDFEAKMQRGSGMSRGHKRKDYFDKIASKQTDEAICKEPSTFWELCCSHLSPAKEEATDTANKPKAKAGRARKAGKEAAKAQPEEPSAGAR